MAELTQLFHSSLTKMSETRHNSLFTSILAYSATNLLNAAIPFLLLPVLTNAMNPSDYGILAMFQVLFNLLIPVAAFNSESALSRYYFDKDLKGFEKMLGASLRLLAGSSALMAILLILFSGIIEKYSGFPAAWLWSVLVFVTGRKLIEIVLTMYRVENKALSFATVRILSTLADIALSILLAVNLNMGWEGRIHGQVWSAVLFGIIALIIIKYRFKADFRKSTAHRNLLLDFGLPLLPHAMGAVIITYSDRLFISGMSGLEAAGIYAVGYQIGMLVFLFQNSFNQAWAPWFFEQLNRDDENTKKRIVRITWLYSIGLLSGSIVFGLLSPLLLEYFISPDYGAASDFVFWVALGFAFNGIYKMFVNYLFYIKETKAIGVATFSTAILNLILNYFFIQRFGAIGAAYSTALCFLIQLVWIAILATKKYSMPWLNFIIQK